MIKILFCRVLGFFLLCCSITNACEVTDDAGQKIHLVHPAKRIISLAPDLTELLFAAGAGHQIVGVMQGSDYPDAAKKIPIVGNYLSLNAEAILSLKPDLIIAWEGGNSALQLQQLKHFPIPVFLSHQRDVTDIPKTLQKLGCLAGTERIANRAATEFLKHYQTLQKQYAHQKPVSVFYEVWPRPLTTINHESWINQIITLCGGKNIFANLKMIAPQVNEEAVIAANPEVIIGPDTTDWQSTWKKWPQLTAVNQKHLYAIHPDWIERAGPRLINGAEEICRSVHPR